MGDRDWKKRPADDVGGGEEPADEEFLDPEGPDESDIDDDDSPVEVRCPHCRNWVAEDADWCPHCRNNISQEELAAKSTSMLTIMLVIVLVVVMAGIVGLVMRGW